ncbi:MAG: aminotransferase class III-fold pyridoxal phosphate-dependent enzyme [Chloroflexi bacterium]|nr:aminotransferase class III-fold pyridoxal phosphate-dependent enzyme [Chloroflexota bacterium]
MASGISSTRGRAAADRRRLPSLVPETAQQDRKEDSTLKTIATHTHTKDRALRARASAVIPGGMYGHQNVGAMPEGFPQFLERGRGSRIWDVDGNEYIDFMCSYGPIVLGHAHPKVDAAAAAQQAEADCQNSPSSRIVELAELLVATIPHADWATFAKNGTDATTWCLMVARAATGRRKVLAAKGAYHGAAPWCNPRPNGTTPEDRANLLYYSYNNLQSVEAALEAAGDDTAGIIVSPFRHDAGFDQELVDPAFARGLRAICDRTGAALILDDVRAGFRLDIGGSWETVGVRPDLSAYSKAIANGYALAAVVGADKFREGARQVFNTGSFWFAAASMAASMATITAIKEERAIESMTNAGTLFRDGLAAQAESHGLRIRQTGPVQMPFLTFEDDADFRKALVFTGEAIRRGVYLHPRHNWFLSAALTEDDIAEALEVTDVAFARVRTAFGAD